MGWGQVAQHRKHSQKGGRKVGLDKLGYQKLLATGKITKPVIVKVTTHSKNAAKKIEEAGGQILSGEEKEAEKESEEFEAETEKSEAESTDVETSDKKK